MTGADLRGVIYHSADTYFCKRNNVRQDKHIPFSRRDARPRHAVQRVKYFAGHHRVTPEPAVGPVFGSIMLGEYLPGFTEPVIGPATSGRTRWFNPGYEIQISKKEAERRQAHVFRWSAPYGRGSR
ncbi:MAG: hypothetical protein ACLP19_08375 [Xanthobacteraceae bacterium]